MRNDVAVIILAGGEGKRIGGAKPLKWCGSERLIDRAVNCARLWSDMMAIAVRDGSQMSAVSAELIRDENVPGPLGGLIAGIKFALGSGRKLVLAIPSDMPFLPVDLLDRLHQAIGDRRCALAKSGGHIHPVCSLWRVAAIDQAQSYAASGGRSLKGLASSLDFATATWPAEPLDPFFNINRSEDLAEALRHCS